MSKIETAMTALFSEKATYLNISTALISFSNVELVFKIIFYTVSTIASIFMIRKTIAETTKIQKDIDKESSNDDKDSSTVDGQ